MNILIIPHLPTLYGRRYNLAKTLAAQGHNVHFVVWDMPYPIEPKDIPRHIFGSSRAKQFAHENFMVHKVRRLPFFWLGINGYLFQRQIRNLFKQYNIDFILSQSYTIETMPPLDLPIVYDMNDDHAAFADVYGSTVYKLAFRLLRVRNTIRKQARAAMLVTYVSKMLAKQAEALNAHSLLLPNGVDDTAFRKLPVRKASQTSPKKLVYVSNFGKWSRICDIVEMVPIVSKEIPVTVDFIGDGTELAKAKAQAGELKLDDVVRFHGKITDRSKVYDFIDAADVCLNFSEKNTFRDSASPIKVLEYSARGKVTVSTDLEEVKLLGFENIVICSADAKPDEFVATFVKALRKSDSPKVAKIVASEYSWQGVASKLLASLPKEK